LLPGRGYLDEKVREAVTFTGRGRVVVVAARAVFLLDTVRGIKTANVAMVVMGHGG
jgi:hypothetical protein